MAGMFFELFILLFLTVLGFLSAALAWRKIWPLLPAFVLMLLLGGVLISDGLRYQTGTTFDRSTGINTFDYDVLSVGSDLTVTTFAYGTFYGAWIIPLIILGLLGFRRFAGVE